MLAWALNLGFGASEVVVLPPDIPGLEYTLPDDKLHFTLDEDRLHYTLPEEDN